ncbi:MAG: SDR family oxidoreductase [Lentisphaeraceae bacterium]|nr:SDR family oxidoreductase [Lentisphaeraceae bacterium]
MTYIDQLFNLQGKVALVTGANGQLGTEFCTKLHGAGVRVIACDTSIPEERNKDWDYRQLDITNKQDVVECFEMIVESYGRFDILVNNAGVSCFENFESRPEESFDWVMDVNLKGTFFCIQAFVNVFDKFDLKEGSIINVGSIFGVVSPDFRNYTDCSRKNSEVYGATKAGIIQMTKYFAVHLGERKIRINCLSPGGVFNPANPQGDDFIENYSFRCPMKRMAEAEEMSGIVLYFAGDSSKYTTGQNVVVDGGLSSW